MLAAGVWLDGLRQRAGEGFEDRLGLVMIVCAGQQARVQRELTLHREGIEKVADHLALQSAELIAGERHIHGRRSAPAQVHGHQGQSLVHGDAGPAHAGDAGFVAQGRVERSTETDRDIFDGMVRIYLQVPAGVHLQIEESVGAKLGEHVVEHTDPGSDTRSAGAVQRNRNGHVGLLRLSCVLSRACHWGTFYGDIYSV